MLASNIPLALAELLCGYQVREDRDSRRQGPRVY